MNEGLAIEDILKRAWSLHRPNGDCRSPCVTLATDGRIIGYSHPNEATWIRHGDTFAFVSEDGRVTSISEQAAREEQKFYIRMLHNDSTKGVAHIMREIGWAELPPSTPNAKSLPALRAQHQGGQRQPSVASGRDIAKSEAATNLLLRNIRRVYFIANNKAIGSELLAALKIGSEDVVVQYNLSIFFDQLQDVNCHKVHFFYPNNVSCWGFNDDGWPARGYECQALTSLTYIFAHWMPLKLIAYLNQLNSKVQHLAINPSSDIPLHFYPTGKAPSCGFISVSFFRYLNWIRSQKKQPLSELVLVGFSGFYPPGKAWWGHDFEFEQSVYQMCPDLRRIAAEGKSF